MYEDLKKLFGTKTPSAKQFKAKLKMLSEEEQCFYRKAALEAAFLDWENMPPRYQEFMTDLFIHRWQKNTGLPFTFYRYGVAPLRVARPGVAATGSYPVGRHATERIHAFVPASVICLYAGNQSELQYKAFLQATP